LRNLFPTIVKDFISDFESGTKLDEFRFDKSSGRANNVVFGITVHTFPRKRIQNIVDFICF